MTENDSALNLEFGSLELICYLVLGIWYLLFHYALCAMHFAIS
jgi:hypothetical protein